MPIQLLLKHRLAAIGKVTHSHTPTTSARLLCKHRLATIARCTHTHTSSTNVRCSPCSFTIELKLRYITLFVREIYTRMSSQKRLLHIFAILVLKFTHYHIQKPRHAHSHVVNKRLLHIFAIHVLEFTHYHIQKPRHAHSHVVNKRLLHILFQFLLELKLKLIQCSRRLFLCVLIVQLRTIPAKFGANFPPILRYWLRVGSLCGGSGGLCVCMCEVAYVCRYVFVCACTLYVCVCVCV